LAERFGLFSVEVEAKGPLRHEAVDPCAGVGVDAKVSEGRDRRSRVEVVEEARNIEEEDSADVSASNGHLRFEAEEGSGVGC
jgi:hypothetical protein